MTTTTAPTTTTTSKAQALAHLLSLVTVSPSAGSKRPAPGGHLSVRATGATLRSVEANALEAMGTVGTPHNLGGQLDGSGHQWRSSGVLMPSTTYDVNYAVSAMGLVAHGQAVLTTGAPTDPVSASIWPVAGIAVGVGEPVELTFSQPLSTAEQKSVLARAQLAMSDPVPGGWHWFSSEDLHFRPTNFWPSGDKVQVSLDLAGLHLGGGTWGVGDYTSRFLIGPEHVSVVNLTTHQMIVSDNGRVIYDWPISAGAPQWPTQDGIHIVLDRTSQVQMISSSVGIPVNSPNGYDETVYWDTQISYSGEYVHAAPWSVSEQGIENVSHGCVNLSPERAEAFFHFSRVGDIVDVVDGVRPPLSTDGGVEDWSFPSSQVSWAPAKIGHLTGAVTLAPTTTLPPPPGAPTTVVPVPTVPPGEPAVTLPVPSTYPPYTPPATTVYIAPTTTVAPSTSTGTTSTTAPKPTTTSAGGTTTAEPTTTTAEPTTTALGPTSTSPTTTVTTAVSSAPSG